MNPMVIDYCEKHNPTYLQYGLSKYLVEKIKGDLPINPDNLVFVDFCRKNKVFYNILFDKEYFLQYNLKQTYHLEDFNSKEVEDFLNSEELENFFDIQEVDFFFDEYVEVHCFSCVKEYEARHRIDLTGNLIQPSLFDDPSLFDL